MRLVSYEKARRSSDEWETPPALYASINRAFAFDCDVCATASNAKHCNYITIQEDALSPTTEWGSCNWCNPPYSNWCAFAGRAAKEATERRTTVMILPPRTGTLGWHRFAMQASKIIFLKGRVSFLLNGVTRHNNGADSCLLVFAPNNNAPTQVYSWDWHNVELAEVIK